MGIPFIFAGIVFLVNPTIRMLDFLPDVIGCLLLILGLSRLYVLDERIERARKMIFYFTAVSAVKLPLSLYLAFKAKEYLLPISFIISVVEIILSVGFFTGLIGGLQYIVSRDSTLKGHLKRSESAAVVSFVFSITKGICSFAPELLIIGEQSDSFDYTFRPTPEQNAALIKPYAELLCFVIILIFGIYTAVLLAKFLFGLHRDNDFIQKLRDRFAAYELDNLQTVTYRRTRFTLCMFFIGIVLLYNQVIDFVNVIPNVLSFVFLAAGIVLASRLCEYSNIKKILPLFILLVPLSIYNNKKQYELLSGTNIDIMGTDMTVREVPEQLMSTGSIPHISIPVIAEYLIIAVIMIYILVSLGNLDFLQDNDTIGIYDILLPVFTVIYLASSAYINIGQHIRTVYSYISNDINLYIHYDSIVAFCEWIAIGSFLLMLYFSYKYGTDLLSRVNTDKNR